MSDINDEVGGVVDRLSQEFREVHPDRRGPLLEAYAIVAFAMLRGLYGDKFCRGFMQAATESVNAIAPSGVVFVPPCDA